MNINIAKIKSERDTIERKEGDVEEGGRESERERRGGGRGVCVEGFGE
jgi:hypothetical protein